MQLLGEYKESGGKDVNAVAVHAAVLLVDHPDLLREFATFLPVEVASGLPPLQAKLSAAQQYCAVVRLRFATQPSVIR